MSKEHVQHYVRDYIDIWRKTGVSDDEIMDKLIAMYMDALAFIEKLMKDEVGKELKIAG